MLLLLARAILPTVRILYLSPRKCWPIESGGRLRDYHLAAQLSQRAQLVHVAVCYPDPEVVIAGDNLPAPETLFERSLVIPEARRYTRLNLVRGILGPLPVTILNYTSPSVSKILAGLGRELAFDTIQVEGAHMISYLPLLRAFPGRPPILCDWHDIMSENMRRYSDAARNLPRKLYARRTAHLLEGVESQMLAGSDFHAVVSDRDRQNLVQRAPAGRFEIIENGVDTEYFSAHRIEAAYQKWPGRSPVPRRDRLVYVGAMDYYPNVEGATRFAREDWPPIRKRFPDLRLTIVGRNPNPEVQALSSRPGIEVTGTVPDVRPYYREAAAVVVPLRLGSGTRLKILEAMSAGIPVVSSALGAEGLGAEPGSEILLADTPATNLEAVTHLQAGGAMRDSLVRAAREMVVRRYDWNVIGERLFSVHKSLRTDRAAKTLG